MDGLAEPLSGSFRTKGWIVPGKKKLLCHLEATAVCLFLSAHSPSCILLAFSRGCRSRRAGARTRTTVLGQFLSLFVEHRHARALDMKVTMMMVSRNSHFSCQGPMDASSQEGTFRSTLGNSLQ